MKTTIEKVVREYIIRVDGLSFPIKARITESLGEESKQPFTWSISHHYSPSSTTSTYYPAFINAPTLEKAEMALLSYVEHFTTLGVTANSNY